MQNMKKKKQEGGKNLFMGLYLFFGTLFVHIKLFLTALQTKCVKKTVLSLGWVIIVEKVKNK